jgi:hypothetical protein
MPSPITTAPIELWRIAREYIVSLFNLFGAPEAIAGQPLYADTRKLLLQWLRTGEAIMRQLLLIEASALGPLPPPPPPRSRKPRIRRRVEFFADKPEDWRVSFRIFMERGRPRPRVHVSPNQTRARTPALHKFFNPWPIAERAEALLRAFNNPEPYARRLARRLRGQPHRAKPLLTLPPNWERCLFDAHEFREAAATKLRHFEPG